MKRFFLLEEEKKIKKTKKDSIETLHKDASKLYELLDSPACMEQTLGEIYDLLIYITNNIQLSEIVSLYEQNKNIQKFFHHPKLSHIWDTYIEQKYEKETERGKDSLDLLLAYYYSYCGANALKEKKHDAADVFFNEKAAQHHSVYSAIFNIEELLKTMNSNDEELFKSLKCDNKDEFLIATATRIEKRLQELFRTHGSIGHYFAGHFLCKLYQHQYLKPNGQEKNEDLFETKSKTHNSLLLYAHIHFESGDALKKICQSSINNLLKEDKIPYKQILGIKDPLTTINAYKKILSDFSWNQSASQTIEIEKNTFVMSFKKQVEIFEENQKEKMWYIEPLTTSHPQETARLISK